jgi:predicted secreted hydrolase
MRSSLRTSLIAALACQLMAGSGDPYRLAMPGYQYSFPRDHFSHPEFQTEWWYYTGNVHTREGRRFGFELTFFRQGVDRSSTPPETWDVRDIWFAHLALSDLDGENFLYTERFNRAGPGVAGADVDQARVWNGNWQAQWKLDAHAPGGMVSQQLDAVADRFSFDFNLTTMKPPIIHGENGVSEKAEGPGHASHYISYTRLATNGSIMLDGRLFNVSGESWMDHEFFTHQLARNQTGWDWFSLQLSDGTEIMLYQLRRKDGSADPYSAGTYVDSQGHKIHLSSREFSLTPGKLWTSPKSRGRYPVDWRIQIPSLGVDANVKARLLNQELVGGTNAIPTYWEGCIGVSGLKRGHALAGSGYLEMTGYAGPVPMSE